MSNSNIPEYLTKDFNFEKLTIPQIRSILRNNDVKNIPAPNQSKRNFLKVFKKEIIDKREDLLKKYSKNQNSETEDSSTNSIIGNKRKRGRPKSSNKSNSQLQNVEVPKALRGKSSSPEPEEANNKDKKSKSNPIIKMSNSMVGKKAKSFESMESTDDSINETDNSSSMDILNTSLLGKVTETRKIFMEDNHTKGKKIESKNDDDDDDDDSVQPPLKKIKQKDEEMKSNISSKLYQQVDHEEKKMDKKGKGKSNANSSLKIPSASIVLADYDDEDDEDDDDYVYKSEEEEDDDLSDASEDSNHEEGSSSANKKYDIDEKIEIEYKNEMDTSEQSSSSDNKMIIDEDMNDSNEDLKQKKQKEEASFNK